MKLSIASLTLTMLALAGLAAARECYLGYSYCGSNLMKMGTAANSHCRAAFADTKAKTKFIRSLWKLLATLAARTAQATRRTITFSRAARAGVEKIS